MATVISMSSSTYPFSYDVCLSYGEDTRDGFTAILLQALYDKKVLTFMDDRDHVLEKGAEISPSLINAIEHSRYAIVILSKDYASSPFCLEQLSSILNCIQDKGRLVLPIFYDIDPIDVRHQRGPYGEAIVRHEEKFKDNMEKVLKWRNALSHVSSLPGWLFKDGKKHKIYRIVEEVSDRLNPAPLPIQIPHTSPSVPRTSPSQVPPNNSQSFPLAPQNSQIARLQVPAGDPRDPKPIPPAQAPLMDFFISNIWRIVGLLSSLVGFPCIAFSPSFIRLIRGWNTWKFIIYYLCCCGVVIVFLFIKQSAPPVRLVWRVWYKIQGFLVLMIIAVCTFYYDKAVDGKPEILSLVLNGALVLMSLSYSKLRKLAYEMGVFSFFLSCLMVQLWTINMKLIWIPICFVFPLFFL